ncbi:MAG: alkaline phosphatase [Devosia sp.]
MPEGALHVLSQNDKGFFLMVEAGAVDWAAHANNLPRIVEEQVEFNHTVAAVVDWLEANTSWEERW